MKREEAYLKLDEVGCESRYGSKGQGDVIVALEALGLLKFDDVPQPYEIQLTPDEAGYYFGMDPERSQWWFDAAAYAKGRHPWHFSVAD